MVCSSAIRHPLQRRQHEGPGADDPEHAAFPCRERPATRRRRRMDAMRRTFGFGLVVPEDHPQMRLGPVHDQGIGVLGAVEVEAMGGQAPGSRRGLRPGRMRSSAVFRFSVSVQRTKPGGYFIPRAS